MPSSPLFDWLRGQQRNVRIGDTVAFDVAQGGDRINVRGSGIDIHFAVEGIALPPQADASFAVWALLPRAMQEGFNVHINRPIDPQVAANAQLVSRIWEMWVPGRFRSVKVSGEKDWSRNPYARLPRVHLFSGGIDSTFSVLQEGSSDNRQYVVTVSGLGATKPGHAFAGIREANLAGLIAKTEPLLRQLKYSRIVIRTNVEDMLAPLTHGLHLASCLFLLSDLFEQGALSADFTRAQDFAEWPWGNNLITNAYFVGSDFNIKTTGAEAGRTEKIASIAEAELNLHALAFCRRWNAIPANCGTCRKCIRTKAMLLIATGSIPKIFTDNSFCNQSLDRLMRHRMEWQFLFDMYFHALDHGCIDNIPHLVTLIEECRKRDKRAI